MLKKDSNGQKYIFGVPLGQVITWIFLVIISAYALFSELKGGSENLAKNVNDNTQMLIKASQQIEKNTDKLVKMENDVNSMRAEYTSEIKHMNQNIKTMSDDIRDIKNYIMSVGK